MSLQDLRNNTTSFDPTVTHDDFLNQLLSGLQTTVSWPEISAGDGGDGQNKPTLSWDGRDGYSSFKSPIGDDNNNNSIQNLFHGFTGSLTPNQSQQFRNLSAQNFGSTGAAAVMTAGVGGGAPSQPRQRVRARRGQATDPHSIAERLRRERIAERMKALQELVTNANKADKASMLDDIIDYVKFLQLQVKVLSMSRLGSAAGAPIVTEGGGGGWVGRSSDGPASSPINDTTTATENQVVKLMEEDMGSAMQYLQGKGLCLMPISLAGTLSTGGCHPSGSRSHHPLGGGEGGGPSSPNMSVLTAHSVNGVKDSP